MLLKMNDCMTGTTLGMQELEQFLPIPDVFRRFIFLISSLVAALVFLNPKVDVVPAVQTPVSTFVILRMWFRATYME